MLNAPKIEATETRRAGARKVLVAEDSAITHDLLKLLLNQRGHEVDIATDGLQALEALRSKDYDVALLDYHLPSADGLQVAAAVKADSHGRRVPRLIAITADPEGLLSAEDGCESFDYILPKPLDINQVGKVVEEQAGIADAEPAQPHSEPEPAAEAMFVAKPSFLDSLGLKFLQWPQDIDATRVSSRAMQASLGDSRFDAIVINVPATLDELEAGIWGHKGLFALPVIDLTGRLNGRADLDASKLDARERGQVERLVGRFRERRARLHPDLLLSDDLQDRLLGRIFVSGRPLNATFEPGVRSWIAYNITLDADVIAWETASLCNRGLLSREFVERFHVCSNCGSERLHVRDVCSRCHSSNLLEEQYLHHFPCGFQGPKSEFERGLRVVCPKCNTDLENVGVDYEQVAAMSLCQNCGHTESKPQIGMVCLDCDARHDWGSCSSRDAYSYQLTDQGTGYAEYGRSFLGLFQKPLRFEELPRDLVLALNEAAKKFNEDRTPFTLVNIFYKNERGITLEQGARLFEEARDEFIENLRAALGAGTQVVEGPSSYDFALIPNKDPREAERSFAGLRTRASSGLRVDLGATMKAFGPHDF